MDIRQEDFVKSIITEKESIEFMSEGLKQAASAARELAVAQNHPIWVDIALLLMELRVHGLQIANGKSLGRQKTLQMLDDHETIMSKKLDEGRPQPKPKFLLN